MRRRRDKMRNRLNHALSPAAWRAVRSLAAAVLLLVFFALAVLSLAQKSPTFDEQGFIVRGLAYLRGENRYMRVGHPLGLNALNALLLVDDATVTLPTNDPSWAETSFHRPAELFLWEIGNDVEHIMFLARLPTVWLGMFLAAIGARWAWELTRRGAAGFLALALLTLDPNILAHARLATTDLGLTAAAALAGFAFWLFLREPSWRRGALAGIAFGLLQDTKFTAGLFVPLFAVVAALALFLRWRRPAGTNQRSLLLPLLIAFPVAAFLTLWAAYGFQIGTLPADLPFLTQLQGKTVPLSHHIEQLLDIGGRTQASTPSFLLGEYSDQGWWYYFPVAFLLKTPLAVLLLLVWSAVHLLSRTLRGAGRSLSFYDLSALLVPGLGFFAIALTTSVNLGYRHILTVLPFLYVFAAAEVVQPRLQAPPQAVTARRPANRLRSVALILLAIWLGIGTLLVYPHFLASFNALAGGPDGGWRALVDSNLDWGQDLQGLASWLEEHEAGTIWLSYFGEARPDYYGIDYVGLDSFPPRLMNPEARPFYPLDPAPGLYAISATNLQGVHFKDHDLYAWFRTRRPLAKIGYSIFLYSVEAKGPPVELALGGIQLDQLPYDVYTKLGSNDVTPHWFDPEESLIVPAGEPAYLALEANTTLPPAIAGLVPVPSAPMVMVDSVSLYEFPTSESRFAAPDQEWQRAAADFSAGPSAVELEGFLLPETAVAAGEPLSFLTRWQQAGVPRTLKIFVHATASGTEPVAQWDGLGAVAAGWRRGDILVQQHELRFPAGTAAGTYEIYVGVYDPVSLVRWQTDEGDRHFLGTVTVMEDGGNE